MEKEIKLGVDHDPFDVFQQNIVTRSKSNVHQVLKAFVQHLNQSLYSIFKQEVCLTPSPINEKFGPQKRQGPLTNLQL